MCETSFEVRSLRLTWPMWWSLISTENTKISQAWWHLPAMPATQEAEAELLEPRRWRLQWNEITPLHSSLGDSARLLSQTNKQTNNNNNKKTPPQIINSLEGEERRAWGRGWAWRWQGVVQDTRRHGGLWGTQCGHPGAGRSPGGSERLCPACGPFQPLALMASEATIGWAPAWMLPSWLYRDRLWRGHQTCSCADPVLWRDHTPSGFMPGVRLEEMSFSASKGNSMFIWPPVFSFWDGVSLCCPG